jgi:hypothetical protein
MKRRRVIALLASTVMGSVRVLHASPGDPESYLAHLAWVAEVLNRMETINPGTTRKTLLTVFTTEGGLSTGLRCTYASLDCPYFKVDVEFQAVGRPDRDADGRETLVESDEDIILTISRPYVQFSIVD